MFRNVTRLVVGLLTIGSLVATKAWTDDEKFLAKDEEYQQHCRTKKLRTQNTCMCGFLKDRQAPQKLSKITGASSFRESSSSSRASIVTAGASCINGFAAGYPCMNADLASFLPLQDIGARQTMDENNDLTVNDMANDIWGWTDAGSGREFAIIGLRTGTSFVEITTPTNPIYLGVLPTHNVVSNWRDIKTFRDHVFIVAEGVGQGMQIFDLTELLSVVNIPTIFSETAHYSGFSNSHNVFVNEDTGFAYAVGTGPISSTDENICPRGLHMIDVNNPTNPTYAGCFNADGYTHDVQCVIYNGPDSEHIDKEICFCCNEDHVTIVDVSIKGAPVELSTVTYENQGYTHQGWLTDDQGFFIFGDEFDEMRLAITTKTLVMNVGDLDNPVLAGTYLSPVSDAIDHNQYVVGNHVFQANYRAGLRVLEMNDIATASFTEVAYFDIYPSDNNAAFNGAWSNYPYFPSGNVVVSGIEQGLFVISLNLGEIVPIGPATIVPPTPAPIVRSTIAPIVPPTRAPIVPSTPAPVAAPTPAQKIPPLLSSNSPSLSPSQPFSELPTDLPSSAPLAALSPSNRPSTVGSEYPFSLPPSDMPTKTASESPSSDPSSAPKQIMSSSPSLAPSRSPSTSPSNSSSRSPSVFSSGKPSVSPSRVLPSSPSSVPSTSTASTPSEAVIPGGAACFSGKNVVTLEGGEEIPIWSLNIGDKVLVHDESYESVYSFGHRNPTDYSNYLRLVTKSTALELSSDHMVFVDDNFVPASAVQIGDILSNGEAVSSIKTVSRQGIYAPFTSSGTVVVGNIVCSSFISLQKDSTYLMLGTVTLPFSWQWIGHTFEMPHRLLSNLGEAYTKDGISVWVIAPKLAMDWTLNQHVVVVSLILIPAIVGLGLLSLIGQLWFVVAITLMSIIVTQRVHRQRKLPCQPLYTR